MKQPENIKTIELPIEEKRGRGRPAKADALNQAERAKRYREKRKAEGIKSDVPENIFLKLSSELNQALVNADAEKEFTRQWFEQSKRFEKAWKEEKQRCEQLQRENDLLIVERGAAWNEIERLKRDASQK